jgi:hypothetical protein
MRPAIHSPPAASQVALDLVHPHCPRCNYDLANIPEDRCPECGLVYSLRAVERVEQFVETILVGDYRAALRWSVAGLFLATLPLAAPSAKAPLFPLVAVVALALPTLIGIVVSLRAFSRDWATPRWVWFSPMIGLFLVFALALPFLLVLLGIGASGMSSHNLLWSTNVPAALLPLDSQSGRRLCRWRNTAWGILGLGLTLQIALLVGLA